MTDETPDRTPGFHVWIDNDACPRNIRDLIIKAVVRRSLSSTFVANSYHRLPPEPGIRFKMVAEGADQADDYIVDHALASDIAITADIPLASRLVNKGVIALNPRGEVYTAANIGERLAVRNLMDGLRSSGEITGGPKEFSAADQKRFADSFDRTLTQALRRGPRPL